MQFHFLAKHSIKTRVSLSIMAMVLTSLWSLSFYASVELKNDLRDGLSAQQFATVSVLAQQLETQLSERQTWLHMLANEISTQTQLNPLQLQSNLDRHTMLASKFNDGVVVLNSDGAVLADSTPGRQRAGLVLQELPSAHMALKEGRSSIGRVAQDRRTGAPTLDIAAPLRDANGQVVGAVIGLTNLNQPNPLASITSNRYGRTGGYLLVDPVQRRVIAATDTSRIMERLPDAGINPALDRFLDGYQGSLVLTNPKGQEVLASDKTVSSTGWIISAVLPTAEAFAPIQTMQQHMLLATLLLTVLAGGLTWWRIRHQLAPVLDTVRALGQRPPHTDAPITLPENAPGEIGELIHAFNTLLTTLAQRNQTLLAKQDMLSRTEALAHLGSWEWDIDTNTISWSPELFQFFRLDPARGTPSLKHLAALFVPQDASRLKEALERAQHYAIPYELELRTLQRNGSQRYYLARGEAQRDAHRVVRKLLGSLQDVTEQRQIQETLQHSYGALQAVLQTTLDGFIRADKQGRLLQVNPAYCAMSGYSQDELLHMSILDLEVTDRQEEIAAQVVHLYQAGRDQFETRHRRKDGTLWDVEVSVTTSAEGGGDRFAFVRDISERKLAQLRLEMAASVFSQAHEGISITDIHGHILDVNDTFCQITGYSRAEVIGKHTRLLKSDRQDSSFYTAMWKALLVNGHWSGEIWNSRKNGDIYPVLLTISAVRDERGVTRQYVALFSDISARKANEDRVRQLAFFDPLTELPNRRLLSDRLAQVLLTNKRSGHFGALLFLDLDNFKPLNDTHGHAIGDLLLMEVARRLKANVREVDTVARLGGDEFVVLLSKLDLTLDESQTQAIAIADKIRLAIARVYQLSRHSDPTGTAQPLVEHHCTASIGVAVFDPSQTDQEEILHQADEAMYRAKEIGRNQVVLHTR